MTPLDPRLRRPPGAAAWLNARRIKELGMLWPVVVLAVTILPCTGAWQNARWATLAFAAVLLAAHSAGSRWAMGARTLGGLGGRAMLVHFAFAFLAGAGVEALGTGKLDDSIAVAGMIGTICIGQLLAVMHGFIAVVAGPTLGRQGHDSRERVLVAVGIAIALVGLLGTAVTRLDGSVRPLPVAWTLVTVVAPLAAVAWGLVRQIRWRRWLAAVAAGEIAGWAIVDELPRASDQPLVPVLAAPRIALGPRRARVLVWTQPTANPFREGEVAVPVALVIGRA